MASEPSSRLSIVAFSGNTHRPSRAWNLAELVAQRLQSLIDADITHLDVLDAGPGLGAAHLRGQLDPQALAVIEAIEQADVLVVTSPVYKGSYTGLFKHVFDFVDINALTGRPVILSATGGGQRHALVVEHQLRPLFGFFSALTIPTAIYADDASFEDGQLIDAGVLARVDLATAQCAALLRSGVAARPASPRSTSAAGKVVPIKG